MEDWNYFKTVKANEINYVMINSDGRYCRVTIRPDYMNQQMGWFRKEDEEQKIQFISRMKDVGNVITEEEFMKIQNFYATNGGVFMDGKFDDKGFNKIINENNVIDDKKPDVLMDEFGRTALDF